MPTGNIDFPYKPKCIMREQIEIHNVVSIQYTWETISQPPAIRYRTALELLFNSIKKHWNTPPQQSLILTMLSLWGGSKFVPWSRIKWCHNRPKLYIWHAKLSYETVVLINSAFWVQMPSLYKENSDFLAHLDSRHKLTWRPF